MNEVKRALQYVNDYNKDFEEHDEENRIKENEFYKKNNFNTLNQNKMFKSSNVINSNNNIYSTQFSDSNFQNINLPYEINNNIISNEI